MKLFVGLGNPGRKYAGHRHNVGFMAVERIAERHGFSSWRKRFQGESAEGTLGGEKVLLLKPTTYMNDSGRSVGEAVRYLKIDLADVVVFYDEIDLSAGKLKVKMGGGNAGHNGLRSITHLVGNDYHRVRIGVGHPGHKDLVANYVLHDFAKADRDWLEPLLDAISDASPQIASPQITSDNSARFLSDVALKLAPGDTSGGDAKSKSEDRSATAAGAKKNERQKKRTEASDAAASGAGSNKNRKRGGKKHPAGERQSKRQNALAENLQKWLKKQNP